MLLHDGPKGTRQDNCGVRSVKQTLHGAVLFLANQMTDECGGSARLIFLLLYLILHLIQRYPQLRSIGNVPMTEEVKRCLLVYFIE